LVRNLDLHSQLLSKRPHRRWVTLELSSNERDVRLTTLQHVIRDFTCVDSANSTNKDLVAVLALDSLREMCLIGKTMSNRVAFDALLRVVTA
jgi:hypothetical protein